MPPTGTPMGAPGAAPMNPGMAAAPAQGGAMRSMAQTALGSMVGVMMADSVMGAMRGGEKEPAENAAEGQDMNAMQPTAMANNNNNLQNEVCGIERMSFASK